ncbi:hypothetical protein [Ottowia thiooxydans]|uniref:hypothetical protein n=1 Tax=Ottowia thiooxydans TaxID=219182 RepID=UPI0003FF23B3|nr:hypothetical protein [Ottowia thiooxydans]
MIESKACISADRWWASLQEMMNASDYGAWVGGHPRMCQLTSVHDSPQTTISVDNFVNKYPDNGLKRRFDAVCDTLMI